MSAASDQPLPTLVDKGLGCCRVRHCEQSFLILQTNRGLAPVGEAGGG